MSVQDLCKQGNSCLTQKGMNKNVSPVLKGIAMNNIYIYMNMPEEVDLFDLVTQYPGLLSPFPQVLHSVFLKLETGPTKSGPEHWLE